MKTISVWGEGVKSTPVWLSKAAKYLAKFAESDSGASEANLGHLKRASAAFNELNTFNREIKKLKSRRSREEGGDEELREDERSGGDGTSEVVVDDGKELSKKERKKQIELQNVGGDGRVKADGRKRKKLENGRLEDSEERNLKKKRKKYRED